MLHYTDTKGEHPVLIFLHGAGLDSGLWGNMISLLRKEFRCISIDLPGHGASVNERCDWSMHGYANELVKHIDRIAVDRFTVVGHSMGGQIALQLAIRLSSRINNVILFNSAGIERFTSEEKNKLIAALSALYAHSKDPAQFLGPHTEQLSKTVPYLKEVIASTQHKIQTDFALWKEISLGSIKGMLNDTIQDHLPSIRQPLLNVYGSADPLVPNHWIHPSLTPALLAAELKKSCLQTVNAGIPLAGHFIPAERPAEAADQIRRFLRK